MNVDSIPELAGVEHRLIDLSGGVTIHVADAGPADGPPVMLVHGFPQNWWEWHELIGPLADEGYRVLCPDLRGAGWSSAPKDRYLKNDMADDLAAVIDRLKRWAGKARRTRLGRPGGIHHDAAAPGEGDRILRAQYDRPLGEVRYGDGAPLMAILVSDPDLAAGDRPATDPATSTADSPGSSVAGSGRGFSPSDHDTELYADCMRQPGHAVAGSRWYRTFQNREAMRWLIRGEFNDSRVDVPVRWLHGMGDPVITPTLLRGYADRIKDFRIETVDSAGHWIVEQRSELVLDRLRAFLRET